MYVIRTIVDIVYISYDILTYGVIIRSDKEWNSSNLLLLTLQVKVAFLLASSVHVTQLTGRSILFQQK